MDVAFLYKEALTNAYGLIGHTTTRVISQSPLMSQRKKPKVNQLYFMVKQVFQVFHFNTPFNPTVEEAAEWKLCEREQANKKKVRQLIRYCIISGQATQLTVAMMQDYTDHSIFTHPLASWVFEI